MASEQQTVLVVEDEMLIRFNMVDALEAAGFNVLEASDVEEAVTVLNAYPEIRAVFTDVDMPGSMDGLKLAAVVYAQWPSTKIIVTSGHRHVTEADIPVKSRFFSKPYNPSTIIENLSEMLAA
jgi:DNA-binding NtrC family response regulator